MTSTGYGTPTATYYMPRRDPRRSSSSWSPPFDLTPRRDSASPASSRRYTSYSYESYPPSRPGPSYREPPRENNYRPNERRFSPEYPHYSRSPSPDRYEPLRSSSDVDGRDRSSGWLPRTSPTIRDRRPIPIPAPDGRGRRVMLAPPMMEHIDSRKHYDDVQSRPEAARLSPNAERFPDNRFRGSPEATSDRSVYQEASSPYYPAGGDRYRAQPPPVPHFGPRSDSYRQNHEGAWVYPRTSPSRGSPRMRIPRHGPYRGRTSSGDRDRTPARGANREPIGGISSRQQRYPSARTVSPYFESAASMPNLQGTAEPRQRHSGHSPDTPPRKRLKSRSSSASSSVSHPHVPIKTEQIPISVPVNDDRAPQQHGFRVDFDEHDDNADIYRPPPRSPPDSFYYQNREAGLRYKPADVGSQRGRASRLQIDTGLSSSEPPEGYETFIDWARSPASSLYDTSIGSSDNEQVDPEPQITMRPQPTPPHGPSEPTTMDKDIKFDSSAVATPDFELPGLLPSDQLSRAALEVDSTSTDMVDGALPPPASPGEKIEKKEVDDEPLPWAPPVVTVPRQSDIAPVPSQVMPRSPTPAHEEATATAADATEPHTEDLPMLEDATSIAEALRIVVMTRLRCDRQTREERINPILMANLSIADRPLPEAATSPTDDVVREALEGENLRKKMDDFAMVRPSLAKRFAERSTVLADKVKRLREDYLDLHERWLVHCAQLDSLNRVNAVEENVAAAVAAALAPVTSGRSTRRSTAMMGDAVRSDLEFEQVVASLGIDEATDPDRLAARNLARIPDMLSVTRGRVDYLFDDTNHRVHDPCTFYAPDTGIHDWTVEEQEEFVRRFALYPKQFGFIADGLPNKTQAQCVDYYYLHKKTPEFRRAVARYAPAKRRGRRTEKPRGHGLLADIRQHDDEIARDGPVNGSSSRRRRTVGDSRRSAASRRTAAIFSELTPHSTPTPDPEPTPRQRRRRAGGNSTRTSASGGRDGGEKDADDPDLDRKSSGRERKRKAAKTPSALSSEKVSLDHPAHVYSAESKPLETTGRSDSSVRRQLAAVNEQWSEEDKTQFLELVALHGDDFKRIAAALPHKTVVQVGNYYWSQLLLEDVGTRARRLSQNALVEQTRVEKAGAESHCGNDGTSSSLASLVPGYSARNASSSMNAPTAAIAGFRTSAPPSSSTPAQPPQPSVTHQSVEMGPPDPSQSQLNPSKARASLQSTKELVAAFGGPRKVVER